MTVKTLGFSKEAWLVVARGGWWSAAEITDLVDPEMDIKCACARLYRMAVRDGSMKRRLRDKTMEYAVTSYCKPPKGLTVAEIVRAVGAAA